MENSCCDEAACLPQPQRHSSLHLDRSAVIRFPVPRSVHLLQCCSSFSFKWSSIVGYTGWYPATLLLSLSHLLPSPSPPSIYTYHSPLASCSSKDKQPLLRWARSRFSLCDRIPRELKLTPLLSISFDLSHQRMVHSSEWGISLDLRR